MRYRLECPANRCVFKSRLNCSESTAGSLSQSGSEFQTVGPATEKARVPKVPRRTRGTNSWWRLADRRCWRPGTSETGTPFRYLAPLNNCIMEAGFIPFSVCSPADETYFVKCSERMSNFPVSSEASCSTSPTLTNPTRCTNVLQTWKTELQHNLTITVTVIHLAFWAVWLLAMQTYLLLDCMHQDCKCTDLFTISFK